MSLLAQPGVQARDLIKVIPLTQGYIDPDDPDAGYGWIAQPPLTVYSRKLTSGEAYVSGKTNTNLNYILYTSYRRGDPQPVTEKQRIWHPEGSERDINGDPIYESAFEIRSVVCYARDGVCKLDISRDW